MSEQIDISKLINGDEPATEGKSTGGTAKRPQNPNKKQPAVNAKTTSVNVGGKRMLRIPWVQRVKAPLLKAMWALPLYTLYMMYVTWEAGELGINTMWCGVIAFAMQAAIAVAIKFTDTEDYWNISDETQRNQ